MNYAKPLPPCAAMWDSQATTIKVPKLPSPVPTLSSTNDPRARILDGTGPFSELQYKRLYEKAEAQLTVASRVDELEKLVRSSSEAQSKLDDLIKGVFDNVSTLRGELREERQAREHLGHILREQHRRSEDELPDRLKPLEIKASSSIDRICKLERALEASSESSVKLAAAAKASDAQLSEFASRCALLEKTFSEVAEKHERQAESSLQQFHEKLAQECGQTMASLQSAIKREVEVASQTSEEKFSLVHLRLGEIEARITAADHNHGQELSSIRADVSTTRRDIDRIPERLTAETHAREMEDRSLRDAITNLLTSSIAPLNPRLEHLEQAVSHASVKYGESSAGFHTRLENLDTRLMEDKLLYQDQLTRLRDELASVHNDAVAKAKELQTALKTNGEQIKTRISDCMSAWNRGLELVNTRQSKDCQEREQLHAGLQARLDHVEEISKAQKALFQQTHDYVDEAVSREQSHREALQDSIHELLQEERTTREAADAALQERLAQTDEQLREESAKRPPMLQAISKSLEEQMAADRKSREVAEEAILEQLAVDRVARIKNHDEVQERFSSQRQVLEANQTAMQQSMSARVETAHQAVESCHGLIRKEIEDWAAETKKVWRVIASLKEAVAQAESRAMEPSYDVMRLPTVSRLRPHEPSIGSIVPRSVPPTLSLDQSEFGRFEEAAMPP